MVLAVGSQVLASRLRIPALISLLPADFTAGALTTDVNPGRLLVPVYRAGSITQFTAMVSAAARDLPPGTWPSPAPPRWPRHRAWHSGPAGRENRRHEDGRPDGLLEGRAVYQVAAFARARGRVGGRSVHDPHGILAQEQP
jgi:hypothetical protein